MKSVSLPRRADSNNPAKASSDTIDLLALIETEPLDDIAAALANAPPALRRWIGATCERVFVTDRRYTEARLRVARVPINPGALVVAGLLAEALASDYKGD